MLMKPRISFLGTEEALTISLMEGVKSWKVFRGSRQAPPWIQLVEYVS